MSKYTHVFTTTVRRDPALLPPLKIEVDQEKWENLPHEKYARPQSPDKQAAIKAFIEQALKDGLIQKSEARQFSQVLLTRKPNGKWRFCVDYRRLNLLTKALGWPLQNIESLLLRIGRKRGKFFATLDLTSGFHQTSISLDSRKYTAFITEWGVYEWCRSPMGPKSVPSYFQEKLQTIVLKDLIGSIVELYIDDLISWAQTESELIENLEKIFVQLNRFNISVNPEKCKFGMTKVEYVGHTLDDTGLHFSPEKLKTVEDFRLPETQKDLKSFLGLASYFRSHIANHAALSRPLQLMLPTTKYKPRERLEWTKEQTTAFETLRAAVATCPKLHFLVSHAPVFLRTDASDYGIGAYLFQVVTDGLNNTMTEHPIAFLSKTLSGAQLRWSTIEKEAFAIYHAITKWSHYLQDIRFTLQTDHANLTFINANSKGKVQRWKLELQDYDFDIQHIAGVDNEVADFFSRGCAYPPRKEHQEVMAASITNCLAKDIAFDYADYIPILFSNKEECSNMTASLSAIMSTPTSVRSAASDIHAIRRDRYDLLTRAHGTGSAADIRLEQSSLEWVQSDSHWIRHPSNQPTPVANPKTSIVGHGGVEATIRNLDKLAAQDSNAQAILNEWTGKRQDVRTFIRHCPCCQKMARLKIPIHTRPFTIASYGLWDCVAMDAIGPFPISRENNKYLMVIIDTFSRYVELIPIKDTTAASAVAAIIPFIGRYGIPSVFLTDNATQFVNATVKELMAQIDCNHITIHPHSHEENGIVERINREVKKHIRDLIFDSKQPDIWDLKAPFAQRIINSQKHRATGVTPSELVFGHSLDLDRNILTRSALRPRTSLSDIIAANIKIQEEMLHKAFMNQTATDTHHIDTAIRGGNTNQETEFPINSYVLVQYENRGGPKEHAPDTPLHPILRGPFKVVHKRSRDAQGTIYTCQHMATNKLEDFHVKLLQPFQYDERRVSPADIAETDYNLFEVEAIRKHRWTSGKNRTKKWLQFLVKWKGYDEDSNTWEPWENVAKVGILHEYLAATPGLTQFVNKNLVTDPDDLS